MPQFRKITHEEPVIIPALGHLSPTQEVLIHEYSSIKIYESEDDDKKRMVIRLIKSGLSKNHYYFDCLQFVVDLWKRGAIYCIFLKIIKRVKTNNLLKYTL